MVLACNAASEKNATDLLEKTVKKCVVKSKTVQKENTELTFEVRLKDENTDFINELSEIEGVKSAVLVSYNGEYMG